MMLPLQEILNKYNVHPKGIIHVGAHWAEEHEDYLSCGIKTFVYIEPCKEAMNILYSKFIADDNVFLVKAACGSKRSLGAMYVSHQNQGQSNSLLEPKLHLQQHPEIVFNDTEGVEIIPLDEIGIMGNFYNMLAMDVQGFEGEVLKGATETLKHIDIIYTEVNRGQTYAGNMEIEEMDEFLAEHGFIRVETYWPSENWTWGDACYIRKSLLT